jgi:CRP/FNR family transcriptional regulator, polysaccharide utilization system transcription regulator
MGNIQGGNKIVDCLNCFRRAPIFDLLSNEELLDINCNRTEVLFKPGELIHKSGTQSSHVISFNSGLAKLYIEDHKGRNKIIKLIKPHDFFVSPGVFSDNRHHFSIKTLTESSVCMIESEVFKDIMKSNTKFAFEYISLINSTLLEITEKIHNLVRKNNTGKLAETLLYLANEIYKTNPFTIDLSSSDIADLCGIGRDSTIRILNDFKNEGIIEHSKKTVKIINWTLLENISENG